MVAITYGVIKGYTIPWTGFGEYVLPNNEFVQSKKLWDWMELFLIPLVLAIGGFALNNYEREAERKRTENREKLERDIALDRQQEDALQAYINGMADLLLKEYQKDTVRTNMQDVARIRTLTVVRTLDPKRKGLVVIFLYEADLIKASAPIVKLKEADLSNADLQGVDLQGADLSGANLENANLKNANLIGTNLSDSNLQSALFDSANLMNANLRNAKLQNAKLLGADLSNAILDNANLYQASMINTDLFNTSLKGAELHGANIKDLRGSF